MIVLLYLESEEGMREWFQFDHTNEYQCLKEILVFTMNTSL